MSQSSDPNSPNVIYIAAGVEKPSKPQTISTVAGAIIFLSAGMNMALGLGWYQYSVTGSTFHFCYSWFIGVIIGTILTAPLVNFIAKKFIMGLSTLLILIGGILFTSVPDNYATLLTGRYFNGLAIGLATVPFLMNAGEIAANSVRGVCLAMEQYAITFGIMIQMIYASLWSYTFNFPVNRVHGIIDIVFAIIAGIFLIFFVESPIDHIRKGDEATALDILGNLRQPKGITREVQLQFEEQRAYVREQDALTMQQSFKEGLVPLVKMIFFRSMMLAFSYSLTLNAALQYSSIFSGNTWAPSVAGCARAVGAIIAICLVDNIGRKFPSIFSAIIVGGLLIGVASLFRTVGSILILSDMNSSMILIIVMQAITGFFSPFASIFIGEAFPLRVKPYMMGICVILEQIIHIIIIVTLSSTYMGVCLLVQGIMIVAVFLLLLFSIPETRKTSLAEAQRRFRNVFNTKLNIEL
ncbi:solute carrier family 2, facilitated glucose transporter member 3-like [Haematobia irritans]|uniref:solute carrier family 2, facilitated glucose transporter member 3-like n=1 Tax=Haematobia irritans TaxID=7368 RepID=UPI003F5079C9